MAISGKDRLTILENVLARVGMGSDVLSEYTKALSALNGLDTMSQMQPPITPNLPPQQPNNTVPSPMGTEPTQNTAIAGNMPQNTPQGVV